MSTAKAVIFVLLPALFGANNIRVKIRYQRTLVFITNREAISVKLLHDLHSFLAPNTPRGSLLEVHFERFTPKGSILGVHSQIFTLRGSLPEVHSQKFSPRDSGEALWYNETIFVSVRFS